MQRLTSRLARAAPSSLSGTRQALQVPSRAQRHIISGQSYLPRTYGTTSSPKQAEDASAESGGSRSKIATETGSSPTGGTIEEGGPAPKRSGNSSENGNSPTDGVVPDELADGDALGRTGGGKPLEGSHDAPKPPKVDSFSLPGGKPKLTKEQQAEVDEHNRDFEAKHGKAEPAEDDKVDSKFWGNKERE